nr:MAG TPA: hypothetical protein [Bacteriophage sp.]
MFLSTSIFLIDSLISSIASLISVIFSERLFMPVLLDSISSSSSFLSTVIEVLILLISTFISSISSVLASY